MYTLPSILETLCLNRNLPIRIDCITFRPNDRTLEGETWRVVAIAPVIPLYCIDFAKLQR
jgi:hypothetical protein